MHDRELSHTNARSGPTLYASFRQIMYSNFSIVNPVRCQIALLEAVQRDRASKSTEASKSTAECGGSAVPLRRDQSRDRPRSPPRLVTHLGCQPLFGSNRLAPLGAEFGSLKNEPGYDTHSNLHCNSEGNSEENEKEHGR